MQEIQSSHRVRLNISLAFPACQLYTILFTICESRPSTSGLFILNVYALPLKLSFSSSFRTARMKMGQMGENETGFGEFLIHSRENPDTFL